MHKSGKYWGITRTLFSKNNTELHHIEVQPGGYCSEHSHRSKFNRFVVLEGRIDILTWKSGEDEDPDRVTLNEFDEATVRPGVVHKFENTSDEICRVLEIYWTELDPEDIQRRTIGGIDER